MSALAVDSAAPVPFVDLRSAHADLHDEILRAWSRILRAGAFVSGAEVAAFEREFAALTEVERCVAVSSGTDALVLTLRALGVGPGHRVIVPANTFIATAEAVSLAGAEPAIVDCDPLTRTISVPAAEHELRTRGAAGVIAVHLYGHPADVAALNGVAASHGAWVIEDAAQAHLARCRGARVGGLARAACFSFYPSKNLGATGEGGAVTTRDPRLADEVRMLAHHGQRVTHHHERVGTNARMSELTAAALRVKLARLEEGNRARRAIAARYTRGLQGVPVRVPHVEPWAEPVWHLYAVEVADRDAVREELAAGGIATGVHYPVPIHRQPAYAHLGLRRGACPAAERSAARVLSLPMFPQMTEEQVQRVVAAVRAVTGRRQGWNGR
jgi:dTDP-3-amino-3,4,6-trideoxy-alpha-D-glucose transaminase